VVLFVQWLNLFQISKHPGVQMSSIKRRIPNLQCNFIGHFSCFGIWSRTWPQVRSSLSAKIFPLPNNTTGMQNHSHTVRFIEGDW